MRHVVMFVTLGVAPFGCAVRADGRRPAPHDQRPQTRPAAGTAGLLRARDAGVPPPELAATERFSVDDLLRLADLLNPDLAVAREEVEAAGGRRTQARLHPNPTFEVQVEEAPVDRGAGEGQTVVSIAQPLVVTARRRAAVDAAAAEMESRRLALARRRREIHADIRAACVDLFYVRRGERLLEDLQETARRTLAAAQARFADGAAPELEVLKARVEAQRLHLVLQRMRRERGAVSARLRALLGGWPLDVERVSGELAESLPPLGSAGARLPPASAWADEIHRRHPAVLALQWEAEAARHRLRQVQTERLGDLELRLGAGRDGGEDQAVFEVGVSVPVPLFDRGQGRIREARALLAKAEWEVQAAVNRLESDLAAARADYETAREQADAYEASIVPGAERALEQTRRAREAGRQGFLDLLDAQRTLAEARQAHLDALRDGHLALIRLLTVLGQGEIHAGIKGGTE